MPKLSVFLLAKLLETPMNLSTIIQYMILESHSQNRNRRKNYDFKIISKLLLKMRFENKYHAQLCKWGYYPHELMCVCNKAGPTALGRL